MNGPPPKNLAAAIVFAYEDRSGFTNA